MDNDDILNIISDLEINQEEFEELSTKEKFEQFCDANRTLIKLWKECLIE